MSWGKLKFIWVLSKTRYLSAVETKKKTKSSHVLKFVIRRFAILTRFETTFLLASFFLISSTSRMITVVSKRERDTERERETFFEHLKAVPSPRFVFLPDDTTNYVSIDSLFGTGRLRWRYSTSFSFLSIHIHSVWAWWTNSKIRDCCVAEAKRILNDHDLWKYSFSSRASL